MIDELLDIVDQHDTVIDQKRRSEIYDLGLSNFRVVNAFLMNNHGQLWIPRRSKNKRIFPLCLDASMGGHVESGESYYQAFERETREELRIDIQSMQHEHIGTLTPHQHKTSAFMHVYLLRSNAIPPYNTNDFIEYYWLKPNELLERITNGSDKGKNDLPIIVKNLLLY